MEVRSGVSELRIDRKDVQRSTQSKPDRHDLNAGMRIELANPSGEADKMANTSAGSV